MSPGRARAREHAAVHAGGVHLAVVDPGVGATVKPVALAGATAGSTSGPTTGSCSSRRSGSAASRRRSSSRTRRTGSSPCRDLPRPRHLLAGRRPPRAGVELDALGPRSPSTSSSVSSCPRPTSARAGSARPSSTSTGSGTSSSTSSADLEAAGIEAGSRVEVEVGFEALLRRRGPDVRRGPARRHRPLRGRLREHRARDQPGQRGRDVRSSPGARSCLSAARRVNELLSGSGSASRGLRRRRWLRGRRSGASSAGRSAHSSSARPRLGRRRGAARWRRSALPSTGFAAAAHPRPRHRHRDGAQLRRRALSRRRGDRGRHVPRHDRGGGRGVFRPSSPAAFASRSATRPRSPSRTTAFDLVLLLNMIPFFPEIARVTAPGGSLILRSACGSGNADLTSRAGEDVARRARARLRGFRCVGSARARRSWQVVEHPAAPHRSPTATPVTPGTVLGTPELRS